MEKTETWYSLQYSDKGKDDWYTTSISADSEAAILKRLAEARNDPVKSRFFYHRAVRQTLKTEQILTREVLPE